MEHTERKWGISNAASSLPLLRRLSCSFVCHGYQHFLLEEDLVASFELQAQKRDGTEWATAWEGVQRILMHLSLTLTFLASLLLQIAFLIIILSRGRINFLTPLVAAYFKKWDWIRCLGFACLCSSSFFNPWVLLRYWGSAGHPQKVTAAVTLPDPIQVRADVNLKKSHDLIKQ